MRFNLRPRLNAFAAMAGAALPTFATWNPADKSANLTLSGGDLIATNSGFGGVRALVGKTTGKYKFEVKVTSVAGSPTSMGIGIVTGTASMSGNPATGAEATAWWNGGEVYTAGVPTAFGSYASGDIISVEADLDGRFVYFQRNGGARSSGYTLPPTVALSPVYNPVTAGNATTANFGASAWAIAATPGYVGWPTL